MSNTHITYLVGAGCGVIGAIAFLVLVVVPAVSSYRRPWEKLTAVVLSFYVLAALVGVGIVVGYEIVTQWPNYF